MFSSRKIALTLASLTIATTLSGCCVTSISCRKACDTPSCPQTYEPIPQGIGPVESPALEPAPTPVPPSPASANRGFGTKTTSAVREMSDSLRDTFTR
ncbi:MAG: hypothetical protein U0941_08640 [Planctomycetaceae bacterium]